MSLESLQHLEALAILALASEPEAFAPHDNHIMAWEQWVEPLLAI